MSQTYGDTEAKQTCCGSCDATTTGPALRSESAGPDTAAPVAASFKIHGMDCAEEVAVLRREVGPIVGGAGRLSFDVLAGTMLVGPGVPVTPGAILTAVAKTGMRAEPLAGGERSAPDTSSVWQRHTRTALTAASALLGIGGFLTHAVMAGSVAAALGSEGLGVAHHVPFAARVLYALGILAGVWTVLPKAWYALRRLRPDMNLLMTVAVLGAVAIGEWLEAATVAFLFALSLALEAWSVGRARRAVAALLDLSPTIVRVLDAEGHETDQAPDSRDPDMRTSS